MSYKKYVCSDCGLAGHKLWRDYGYCDELWCALCCEKRIAKAEEKHPSDPWDKPHGPLDMMRYGFSGVAAIPTDEDCDVYQSAGALKAKQLLWWHSLPTYEDQGREIRTVMAVVRDTWDQLASEYKYTMQTWDKVQDLRVASELNRKPRPDDPTKDGYSYRRDLNEVRALMLSMLQKLYDIQGLRLELYSEQSDLEWQKNRAVLELTGPAVITVWGSKTQEFEHDGKKWYITGGEEQPMSLTAGQRIAVSNGRGVVLTGDRWQECPTIMDFGQDADALVRSLLERNLVRVVKRERPRTER